MIPLGNWEETNDELRNEIAGLEDDIAELDNINSDLIKENEHLQSALNAADTDIADYLFELDHLHHKHAETELDVEGLLTLVEYWQEKAATAEAELGDAREALADLKDSYNEMYEDYSKVSYQLTDIHALVAYGIPGETVDFVRDLKRQRDTAKERAEKAEREFRDYKIVHPEQDYNVDFWRRQAEELGRQNDELRSQLDESDRSHGELDFVYRNLLDSHIELKKALKTLSE